MEFKEWLDISEGATDNKHPFRVIFMAGGPGSGKTWIANQMFGQEFKRSNSDEIMKLFSKKSPDIVKSVRGQPDYVKKQELEKKAVRISKSRTDFWVKSGIPFIVDITGRNLALVQELKTDFEGAGYDASLVFVSTSLESALRRNKQRKGERGAHVADEDFLTNAWWKSHENWKEMRDIFGDGNYQTVLNDKDFDQQSLRLVGPELRKLGNKIINQRLKNPKGRSIVNRELAASSPKQTRRQDLLGVDHPWTRISTNKALGNRIF